MKRTCIFLIVLSLTLSLCCLASAEISFTGTVASGATNEVYAPIGGTVETLYVSAGDKVTPDTVLAALRTTKVYATEDGTVTGIFCQPGDNAETISSRYGAVMYIEGDTKYSMSVSTEYAYDSVETQYVRVGEKVWIKSRSNSSHKGTGMITAISGTNFTVELDSGSFLSNESSEVFRESSTAAASRLGRGNVVRKDPVAVSASGSIVSIAVKDGDTVKRGDLLLETLDGSFDGLYMSGTNLYAGVSGVVSKVNVEQGSAVQKNAVVAAIYPEDSMRIEASVYEDDLSYISIGMPVQVELNWNQDDDIKYSGTITGISHTAQAKATNSAAGSASGSTTESDTVNYTVYISFTPDESTRYGMSAVITTITDNTLESISDEIPEQEPADEISDVEDD